jgi:glycosyltransferase involved in cell wall biosynthesis
MKISLITVSYNSEKTIRDTIASVESQVGCDIEYILIDGASTDATLRIITESSDIVDRVISEPDRGIYDAMNKGIRASSGDVIGILNSDDVLAHEHVVKDVLAAFSSHGVDAVYGDLCYVSREDVGRVIRHWKTGEYVPGAFARGWHPPHPSFFLRRECYENYGYYDERFGVAADFELMLRMMEAHRVTSFYLPELIVRMRVGGESNRSFGKFVEGNLSCMRAFRANKVRVAPWYPVMRLAPKLAQFAHRPREEGSAR